VNSVIRDGFDGFDVSHLLSDFRRFGASPLDAENDVLGGERRTAVEAYPFAKLELPGVGVQRPPLLGQLRQNPQIGIDVEELLVHLCCRRAVGVLRTRRVHGDRTACLTREAQHILRRGWSGEHRCRD
jgi:hypothetical protein